MILSYILVVAVFVVLWVWLLLVPLQSTSVDEQAVALSSVADATVYILEEHPDSDFKTVVENVAKNDTMRVSIIAANGHVLADSRLDLDELDNHLERPEIVSAQKDGVGISVRTSDSDNKRRIYVAKQFENEKHKGYVRIAEQMNAIDKATRNGQISGFILLVIGIIVLGIVAATTLRRATSPVGHLERVRTDFVANASHELKTPVAGIKLLAESLEIAAHDKDYETVEIFSQRLGDETERLQSLVTDLLDLSRLEQSDIQARKGETDLHAILSAEVESRRSSINTKGLYLKFIDSTPQNISTRFPISSSDAALIIDNLIDNAIRYTDEGGVTVTLFCDKKEALIKVSDTGIGMSADVIPRIFERFYRVDVARSRELGGTGLGLSLVRHAVLKSRGTIEVDSTVGEGTTFRVRIPR